MEGAGRVRRLFILLAPVYNATASGLPGVINYNLTNN